MAPEIERPRLCSRFRLGSPHSNAHTSNLRCRNMLAFRLASRAMARLSITLDELVGPELTSHHARRELGTSSIALKFNTALTYLWIQF